MRKRQVTLTSGDELTLSSLTLEQVDAISSGDPANALQVTRQAVCDSLNNAAGEKTWDIGKLAQSFDPIDLAELVAEVQKLTGMVNVGEAAASQ